MYQVGYSEVASAVPDGQMTLVKQKKCLLHRSAAIRRSMYSRKCTQVGTTAVIMCNHRILRMTSHGTGWGRVHCCGGVDAQSSK